jgi:hypothetical protein
MGLELPDWLIEALSWVGCTWPEADETMLIDIGNYWLEFAGKAEEHAELAVTAVDSMLVENKSPGLTAFAEYWDKVAGEAAYMPDCRIVATAIGIAFLSAGILVLVLKILVIVQLIAFAIILVAAIAAAFFTLGASLAAAAEIAIAVNRAIVYSVNLTITAIRELGPPLTELATEHLSEQIVRLDGRPIHHSDRGVDDYKTPEQREREKEEYERRKQEIAYDHAKGGVTPGSLREAEVALGLEATGTLKPPVGNSTRPEADFVDGNGKEWDHKGFLTHSDPNRTYDRTKAEANIQKKLDKGINVALDLRGLSPADREDIKDLVASNPRWAGRVVVY